MTTLRSPRRYGWHPSLPDYRDQKLMHTSLKMSHRPSHFSLVDKMPPVWDQGQLGSCFTGNTKVPLLNGKTRTLKQLAEGIEGSLFYVYSINENGRIVAGKATASKTGINRRLMNVYLDNGEVICCTPDHQYLMRDGEYIEARYLQSGDSLMPLYRYRNNSGYESVFNFDDNAWHLTHWLSKTSIKCKPDWDDVLIHHKDFNKKNNDPTNLRYMHWAEHSRLHCYLGGVGFAGWNGTEEQREHSRKVALSMHRDNPGWNLEGASKGGKTAWEKARKDPEMMDHMMSGLDLGRTDLKVRRRAIRSIRQFWANASDEILQQRSKASRKGHRKAKEANSLGYQILVQKGKKLGGLHSNQFQAAKFGKSILDNGEKITRESWDWYRDMNTVQKPSSRRRFGKTQKFVMAYNQTPKFDTALSTFGNKNSLVEACVNYNHKVVKTEYIDRREDVYCLTVPEYENFAIKAGVFVHNCTAHASGAAFEYELQLQKYPVFRPSRLFIYYNARKIEGTTDSDNGAELRDVIKGLATYGAPPEIDWPYNEALFSHAPPEVSYQHGKQHLVTKYFSVRQSVADICTTIADGRPVIFGFSVYSGFESEETAKTGILKLPEPEEELVGGHAVAAVGFDDSTRYIIVRNSWGINFGKKGYFLMPYAYIESPSLASDFWVIQQELGSIA